jgi:prepilin-type processing-associated H-X9-DG protein
MGDSSLPATDPLAIPVSYAPNARVMNAGSGARSVAEVKSPTLKILVAEHSRGWTDYGAPWHNGASPNDWDYIGGNSANSNFRGHLGVSNYLYADGHVKAVRPGRTHGTGFNMWGAQDGGTNPTVPAGVTDCDSANINCDLPFNPGSPPAEGLAALDKAFQ